MQCTVLQLSGAASLIAAAQTWAANPVGEQALRSKLSATLA